MCSPAAGRVQDTRTAVRGPHSQARPRTCWARKAVQRGSRRPEAHGPGAGVQEALRAPAAHPSPGPRGLERPSAPLQAGVQGSAGGVGVSSGVKMGTAPGASGDPLLLTQAAWGAPASIWKTPPGARTGLGPGSEPPPVRPESLPPSGCRGAAVTWSLLPAGIGHGMAALCSWHLAGVSSVGRGRWG